jgi:hypothetical protein
MQTLRVEIIDHPTSTAHCIAKVVVGDRVYAVTYAEPFPSVDEVRELWRTEQGVFRPYDESTGLYLV